MPLVTALPEPQFPTTMCRILRTGGADRSALLRPRLAPRRTWCADFPLLV